MKRVFLGLFILICVTLLFAPTLLSTHWGKDALLSLIARSSNYKITLDHLSLSWFGPQTLEHLEIREKADEPFVSCEKISCSAPLWGLLLGKRDFHDLNIIKPSLTLKTTTLTQPISFMKVKKAALVPSLNLNLSFLPAGAHVQLSDGEFTLLHEKTLLACYRKLQMEVEIPVSRNFVKWDLSGETTEGKITGTLKSRGKMDTQDLFTTTTKLVNFPLHGIDALLSFFHPKLEGLILEALGPSMNLSLEGSLSPDKLICSFSACSPLLTAELQATGGPDKILLSEPGKISFSLTPSFAKRLAKLVSNESIIPQKPVLMQFAIEQFNLPIHDQKIDFGAIELTASLVTEFEKNPLTARASYSSQKEQRLIKLQANSPCFPLVQAAFKWNDKQGAFTLNLDVEPKSGDLFSLVATGTGDLDLVKETLQAKSNLTFSKQGKKWGSGKVNLDAREILSRKPNWNFIIDAQGQEVNIKGSLNVQNGLLQLQKEPFEIFFTLTDESFARIERSLTQKNPEFELSQPSVLALTISRLTLPLSSGWREMLIVAEGGFDKFAFMDKGTGQQVKLTNFQLKIDKSAREAPFSFNLESQIATRESQSGKISCQGKLVDFTDLEHPSLQLDLELVQLPTAILDLASHFATKNSFSPLFGDKLEATAHIQLEKGFGPIELNVNSSNTRLSLNGGMKEGVLSLLEPAHAQILMTKELSELLLKEINPLSISSLTSSSPFTVQIDSKDFLLPLNNWRKLSLSHAKIELGKISCLNEGSMQVVLGLLKSKELFQEKKLDLWFAPIELSIKEGAVSLERTEILVDNTYEIASWGSLDLKNETVDMILGLTSQCLSKAFAINNLPEDYVMQIPMKGKMNNVKLDTKAATAKIAALMVWQQSSKADPSKGSGLIGKGFGELVGRLATLPDRGASTPPAKHPFPWEKYKPTGKEKKSEASSERAPKKKNRIQKGDKPLKQLLKILR